MLHINVINTYVYSAANPTTFFNIFNTQLTILPIMVGSMAKAFDANFPSNLARAVRFFFTHRFTVFGSLEGGFPLPEPPPIPKAFLIINIIVLIVIPVAVKTAIIVIPCSRNRVFIRSFKLVSPSKTFSIVCRILAY